MYILGISCYYHDASAALMKNGVVVAAAAEERFSRKKHDTSFPQKAIEYCLKSQDITIKDIDYTGFYEKPLLKFERIIHQHLQCFPSSFKTFIKSTPLLLSKKLRILKKIRKFGYKKDVIFTKHHLSHAAAGFLPSHFQKAAILTVDGVGEWATTSYGIGENNKLSLKKQIIFPHSIGLFYSTITALLGFRVNNSEYKVMGLSTYGNNNKNTNIYYKKLKKIIDIKKDGSFALDMTYFSYHKKDHMPSKKLISLLGGKLNKIITKRHEDIAAAAQMIYEEVFLNLLNNIHKKTKLSNLIVSGGCALNSVANGKITKNTPFKKVFILPDPGDGGSSMGVCYYIYNSILKNKRIPFKNIYIGPEYPDIEGYLKQHNIPFKKMSDTQLFKKTAELIYQNKIVGWFQGRMEFGPRALGNRSILANPCNKNAKDILNTRVKHREEFRPFAPAVCKEDAKKYFSTDDTSLTDYMLSVCQVKTKYKRLLPSITHVDGSARVQTVKKDQNLRFYKLIKQFGKLSGVPVIINTSFNVKGEQ